MESDGFSRRCRKNKDDEERRDSTHADDSTDLAFALQWIALMARHPHRLPRDCYTGPHTYFLTVSTFHRKPFFGSAELVSAARDHFLRAAGKHGFAEITQTYMPDHVHLLLRGERADADFIKWLDLWRQLVGFYWRQKTGQFLWEEGYWDYTLRNDDAMLEIASYIVWNPVRAGLVERPEDYPFTSAVGWTIQEIAEYPPRRPW